MSDSIPTASEDCADSGLYLCGGNESRAIRFALNSGVVRVGSSPESDLCLADGLVSRHHALLTVSADGVVVEDRGSTNGSFINGHRIRRGILEMGSSLRLGSFRLGVERQDPDDVRVAISLAPKTAEPLLVAEEASTIVAPSEPGRILPAEALALLEDLVLRLAGQEDPKPATLLPALRAGLALEGVALVGWEGEQPVARSADGIVGRVPASELLFGLDSLDLEAEVPADGLEMSRGRVRATVFDFSPPIVVAAVSGPAIEPRALVLWFGEASPAWGAQPGLVRCLGSLVLAADRTPRSRSVRRGSDLSLRFPAGFVPGSSPRIEAVYDQLRPLARSRLPVVLTGESGVGKEGVARTLHRSSDRADGPWVVVDCAAMTERQFAADLFGVAPGVAGAEPREGLFQQADRGTLFLDQFVALPLECQSRLLRPLQEGRVTSLGGRPEPVDVRILSATNQDLERALSEGRLREDLYYRLAGTVVCVPPLRRRQEDLPGLIEHFLGRFSSERGIAIAGVTVGALRLLSNYHWPGNVRQLEHEMRRLAFAVTEGGLVDSASLSDAVQWFGSSPMTSEGGDVELAPRVDALERRLIREALRRTGGLRGQAAGLLGLSRNGLAKKMRRLGIDRERKGADGPQ